MARLKRKRLKRKKAKRTSVTISQLRYWRNQDIRKMITDTNESVSMRKKAEKEFLRRVKTYGFQKAYSDE